MSMFVQVLGLLRVGLGLADSEKTQSQHRIGMNRAVQAILRTKNRPLVDFLDGRPQLVVGLDRIAQRLIGNACGFDGFNVRAGAQQYVEQPFSSLFVVELSRSTAFFIRPTFRHTPLASLC
jgi:hypothetical protein